MTQLCCSDSLLFLALLLDDLLRFCCFLACNSLYLAYLLYFSPYLLQLLSFLSPLLLSTSLLLLLAFLTVSPYLNDRAPARPEFFGNTCAMLHNFFKAKLEGDATIGLLEQLASMVLAPVDDPGPGFEEPTAQDFGGGEVSELGFQAVSESCGLNPGLTSEVENPIELPLLENPQMCLLLVSNVSIGDRRSEEAKESPIKLALENSRESDQLAASGLGLEEVRSIAGFVEESPSKVTKESDLLMPQAGTGFQIYEAQLTNKIAEDSAVDASEFNRENPRKAPDPFVDDAGENVTKSTSRRRRQSRSRASDGLERDNSMRKEREWKRTLACKLFEERVTFKLCREQKVAEGGEEMDLLWEAYEANASRGDMPKSRAKKGKKDESEEEEEEGEEEEGVVGQPCCLQALRGKMNLGMGRPNMAKISKVLKGMTLFQRIGGRSSRKRSV